METRKLFYEDVNRHDFCATVLSCTPAPGGFAAVLDATAFYPEGGGQPADRGALGGARVTDVHEKDGVITHFVTVPLRVGTAVQGNVDRTRRLVMMQQHTGEHIVSGIVHAQYGYDNVGFHIGEETTTVDFSGPLTADDLRSVESAANWVVWQSAPVTVCVPTPTELAQMEYRSKKELSGAVRIVNAGGADVCACCGTHVSTTGEVGCVKLLSAQSYKGGTRVTMVCGIRAFADYTVKFDNNAAISVLLSAKPDETAAAVQRLFDEAAALRAKQAALENRLFALLAETARGQQNALRFEDGLSPDSLHRLCGALCAVCPGVCAAFSAKEDGFSYALSSANADVRALCKILNTALDGRGGGKPGLCQGSVRAARAEIEAFFAAQGFAL